MRYGIVVAAALLVGSGCVSPDGARPHQVAPAYAPELGVDLAAMEEGEAGLRYQDLRVGHGAVAERRRTVVVHYTGWLADGTRIDSSHDHGEPLAFMVGVGRVIRGWDLGVVGMREGGIRRLVIPYGLAYGVEGRGPIPSRATLVFDIELLAVR